MKTIIKIGSRKLTIQVAIALFLILAVILLAQESEDVTPTEEATTEEADATAVSDTTTGDELPPARKTSGTGIAAINAAYEAGTEALSKDDTQAAISHFQKAAESADNFLKGIVNPSEEAQAKYFRGLALYYWGKLDENSDRLEQASTAFGEAINAFKNIEKLGRFYLDSKYRQGMCSYRQYQLTRVESEKIRKLGEAYGDFRDFIEDPALESVREEMAAEIERAQYLAALCLFERGAVKLYQSSEYKSAKEDLTTSASYFAELENAQDQHIAVLAKLMEGECHYYLARLYMQIRPDEWDERKLSNQRRDEVISSELSTAEDRIQAAKKAMGTFTAVEPYITYSLFANRIARGATGDLSELRQVMEDLANQSPTGMWSNEKEMRAADTQLLRYFAGQAASGAAVGGWQRLVSDFPIANYWMGWINYIEAIEQSNKYPQASTQFTNFLGRVGGSTRESMMKADAKFRDAECTFWNATLKELAPALQDAKASYKSLTSSQGAYLRYLPEHIAAQAQVRIQIIEVQERMAAGTSDINRVITNLQLSGLDLPKDAKAYLNFGRYFLEKANREAAQKRLLDIGLALGLFGHVAGTGSVASGEKNEAKFLQGVAYIKKATAVESSAEANEAMSEAKNILNGVGSPLDVESKYAIGIGYFNIEDRSNAQSALSGLKDKYVRPAFVYGMASGNCVTKGTYMRKVIASTERASTWYLKAQQAFDALDCAANVPPQSGGLRNIGSPITYESLADPKAQMDELRAEGLLMWQKISEGKKIFPMDDLIPDMPPKTTITIKFIIKGTDGKAVTGAHTLIIDGEPELAEKVSGNIYKATLSRANHDIIVELKGYYRFAETMSITEERDVELIIKKAVRYVKASNLTESKQPMAVTSSGDQSRRAGLSISSWTFSVRSFKSLTL